MKSIQSYTFSLIVFLLCLCSYANGQTVPDQYSADLRILPPSPNAASLAKYAEIPVDMHTGTPQITIPITSLSGHQLSTNISISYHTGGIKVADFGSWVGLGWSLNAGGVITRSVRGLPDETKNQNIHLGYLHLPFTDMWQVRNDKTLQAKLAAGKYDGQPDEFSFNFGGYAGSFVMRRNKGTGEVEPILLSYQELKIKRIPPVFSTGSSWWGASDAKWDNQKWEIITPDGTRYIFGLGNNTERTETESSYGEGNITYISSWYLSQIISSDGIDVINFTYDVDTQNSITIPEQTRKKYYLPLVEQFCQSCSKDEQWIRTNTSHTYIFLKEISSVNGKIRFIKKEGRRRDLRNSDLLERVERLDYEGNLISSHSLAYDMVDANNQSQDDVNDIRYFLQSLTENSAECSKPPHTFEYYSPSALPKRNSNAIDWWGYYNGAIGNVSLYPDFSYKRGDYIFDQGGNREVNETTSNCGTIKYIHYPTGGKEQFVFENHRSYSNNESTSNFTMEYADAYSNRPTELAFGVTDFSDYQEMNIPHSDTYTVKIQFKHATGELPAIDTMLYVALYKKVDDDLQLVRQITYSQLPVFYNSIDIHLPQGDYILAARGINRTIQAIVHVSKTTQQEEKTPFLSGGLRIKGIRTHSGTGNKTSKVYTYKSGILQGQMRVLRSYQKATCADLGYNSLENAVPGQARYANTARSVAFHQHGGVWTGLATTNTYTTAGFDANGNVFVNTITERGVTRISAGGNSMERMFDENGVMILYPGSAGGAPEPAAILERPCEVCYFTILDTDIVANEFYGKSTVVYGQATVSNLVEDAEYNGSTTYNYNVETIEYSMLDYPMRAIYQDWKTGNLLSEEVRDRDNTLLKKTEYIYDADYPNRYFQQVECVLAKYWYGWIGCELTTESLIYAPYYYNCSWLPLVSKKESLYDPSGNGELIENFTEYKYGNAKNHTQPTEIRMLFDNGQTEKISRTIYSSDLYSIAADRFPDGSENSEGIKALQTKYMPITPIEQSEWENGVLTGSVLNIYDKFGLLKEVKTNTLKDNPTTAQSLNQSTIEFNL